MTLDEIIDHSAFHMTDKYGENGYAISHMYFESPEYLDFLHEVRTLVKDKQKWRERYLKEIK